MARPLRIEFAGALYHLMSRGDGREAIYRTDADRRLHLKALAETCERFNWRCHAYCLMGNHYHLLVETPEANLSRGMHHFNGVYTQRFNRAHERVGHVFQGRFNSVLVEKDSYLLELARYIVLNPVRAGMVRSAADWPWSSYRATAGIVDTPEWFDPVWLLAAFGGTRSQAIARYRRFIAEGDGKASPWEELKGQIYLGSAAFVENMQRFCDTGRDLREIPRAQRRAVPKTLAEYRALAGQRDEAILQACCSGAYSQKEVADYFGLHYSRVSKIVGRARGKT
jgi:putative transposase